MWWADHASITGSRPDDELVERAKRGDIDAYEEIVRRHQATAFRVAYAVCGSREDAEEAAQDAFVKAHRALGRFRSGAPLRPWLLRIVANEARNRRVAGGRSARLIERLAREPGSREAAPSLEPGLLADAERRELLAALARSARPPARRDRLRLPARALRGRGGGRPALPPRHGEVAPIARAGAAAQRSSRRHRDG